MGLSIKSLCCYRRKSKLRKTSLTTGDDDGNDRLMTSHTGRAIIMPNLILIVMVESDMAVGGGGDSPPHSRTPSRMLPQSVTQDDTFSIDNLTLTHIRWWKLRHIMA